MFCFGNLMRESGVVERLSNAAQNELMNIITIFLGVSVGATMPAEVFLTPKVIYIFVLGCGFCYRNRVWGSAAKFMNLFLKEGEINPLIGAARYRRYDGGEVAHKVDRKPTGRTIS